MATYEYEYTRADGTLVRVERRHVPIAQYREPIVVIDAVDGQQYIAERIMSITANMGYSWEQDTRDSDLPPVNAKPEDVSRALKK